MQFNGAAQNFGKFFLHAEKRKAGGMSRFEFNQHVNVTVRAKIISGDGAKK